MKDLPNGSTIRSATSLVLRKKDVWWNWILVEGNMARGVNKENLIIRVRPDYYQEALSKPNAKIFDMTGRPMTGWIVVTEPGYQKDENFQEWVDRGVAFALTLLAK